MAKYTLELRELFTPIKFNPTIYNREEVESWFCDYELTDYLTQKEIDVITERGTWTKEKLAKKIVDHYYMREIGFETIALFRHYAKVTMNELMEEYLPLIYSTAIKFDPLVNVDYKEYFTREAKDNVDNTGKSNSNSNSSSLVINSDTPQGQINKNNILAGNYATSTSANENEINDETNTTSNSQSTTNEDYTRHTIGNSGISASAQNLIKQYREIVSAYDRQIIEKLQILFMGLY